MIETAIIITIIASTVCLLGYLAKLIFQSKCDMCKLGCLEVHRKTKQEAQLAPNMKIPSFLG